MIVVTLLILISLDKRLGTSKSKFIRQGTTQGQTTLSNTPEDHRTFHFRAMISYDFQWPRRTAQVQNPEGHHDDI
jgi:hypothetical protein